MVSRTAITVAIINPAERRREDNVGAPARLCRFHAWELEGYIDTLVDLALPPNTYEVPPWLSLEAKGVSSPAFPR
jgi:hypothetical protein